MLWKKGWWETRWLFLIGLGAIFFVFTLTFVADYDAANWTARLQRNADLSESERQVLNNFQGRVWTLFFKLLLNFIWADYAVIMGALCLMTACHWVPSQGAAGLFTLSLPVSRRKVLLSQALVGLSEIFLVALTAPLILPLITRFHGQRFSWKDALIYTLMMVFGGAVFFCCSFLLTVILSNYIAAFILMEAVVFALFLPFQSYGARPWWNLLGVMAGESYFYHGRIPWLGLSISLILSAIFIFVAVRIYERRDF
jgi:ABC-2 family transporter protein